jgi:2-C-methyl-D-erythritol 4-phosphate cytidylyltransferase
MQALPPVTMPRYFALVPAAGSGSRTGYDLPKQYVEVAGHPLLFHALAPLVEHAAIDRVFVVLAPDDVRFATHDWSAFAARLTPLYCGGETRTASVCNGLIAAGGMIAASDWVLVHDAARPCLAVEDIDRLLSQLADEDTGGLLAVPVADTLKRATADGFVIQTEARENLWQAQTPQMFRYRVLLDALQAMPHAAATDEARAIENLGLKPRLVMGSARNLKVTYPEDFALAALILKDMNPPMNTDKRR